MQRLCVARHTLRRGWTPSRRVHVGQRHYAHTQSYTAAVIGAGITGLTTAHRLSKDPNCSHITVYEKSPGVGGSMKSEIMAVDGGNVIFEQGPRTLRATVPGGLPLMDLLFELDLLDDVLLTSKNSPAARNRYIYYPDRLVCMPTISRENLWGDLFNTLRKLVNEPIFETFLMELLWERWRKAPDANPFKTDESVESFVTRRLGPEMANNIVSAVFHGIYAGDISRLSAQTLMGGLRIMEQSNRGVASAMFQNMQMGISNMSTDDLLALESVAPQKSTEYWKFLSSLIKGASVLTLKRGLGQLPDALAKALVQSGKVHILTNTEASAIVRSPGTSDITICDGNQRFRTHNRVIATGSAPNMVRSLSKTVRQGQVIPHDTIRALQDHNYAVTVMVVNLYYRETDVIPVRGFGYLIPRSVPAEQNPERALGVIFGSETSEGQDTVQGTKVTVMLGGHWWDGWEKSDLPDHNTGVTMACNLLRRHLGITVAPAVARTKMQADAIPQYTVHHLTRMGVLSEAARAEFNNRLTFAGSWYTGVGVTDCIRQGYIAGTYGVGARKLDPGDGSRPWRRYGAENWQLEGGVATAPVTPIGVFKSERKHY
ncbi:putative protoporphyrinogen oxidase [Aspergillus campestris IBT 28561]|uniref:Protoporphyrinogen oxidase n=1 Tax=Aspergillus campestris (strain IBT 28561) TaxID=1392248 RepID=A0A2I1CZN8_ASPC2|nr:putative protoporphyrinogen oxidase [Aspergillus campestris IBT 28561]PKY03097.1 putative protoporphyrinogen oxidase [Aspergillus campestris IBT 28561]